MRRYRTRSRFGLKLPLVLATAVGILVTSGLLVTGASAGNAPSDDGPVDVRVSLGPCPSPSPVIMQAGELPDVTCYSLGEAEAILHKAGYMNVVIAQGPTAQDSLVEAVTPMPNSAIPRDSAIRLFTMPSALDTSN